MSSFKELQKQYHFLTKDNSHFLSLIGLNHPDFIKWLKEIMDNFKNEQKAKDFVNEFCSKLYHYESFKCIFDEFGVNFVRFEKIKNKILFIDIFHDKYEFFNDKILNIFFEQNYDQIKNEILTSDYDEIFREIFEKVKNLQSQIKSSILFICCAREYDPDSLFNQDYFPSNIFKEEILKNLF